MSGNATAAATPSYSAAWDLVHQRFAAEDARVMDELNQRLRHKVRRRAAYGSRSPEIRAREAAYRANKGTPIPPCAICGGPRMFRNGTRCKLCRNKERCSCGAVRMRQAKCGECKS